jgi:hypothetical protein
LIKSQLLYQLSYRGNQHCDVPRRIGTEAFYFTVAKQQALLADIRSGFIARCIGRDEPPVETDQSKVKNILCWRSKRIIAKR